MTETVDSLLQCSAVQCSRVRTVESILGVVASVHCYDNYSLLAACCRHAAIIIGKRENLRQNGSSATEQNQRCRQSRVNKSRQPMRSTHYAVQSPLTTSGRGFSSLMATAAPACGATAYCCSIAITVY